VEDAVPKRQEWRWRLITKQQTLHNIQEHNEQLKKETSDSPRGLGQQ